MLNQVQHDTIFHVKYIPLLLVKIKNSQLKIEVAVGFHPTKFIIKKKNYFVK